MPASKRLTRCRRVEQGHQRRDDRADPSCGSAESRMNAPQRSGSNCCEDGRGAPSYGRPERRGKPCSRLPSISALLDSAGAQIDRSASSPPSHPQSICRATSPSTSPATTMALPTSIAPYGNGASFHVRPTCGVTGGCPDSRRTSVKRTSASDFAIRLIAFTRHEQQISAGRPPCAHR